MGVVLYEKRDHLVHVTLNRPEAMNALSVEVQKRLLESWEVFRGDDDAWVAIVLGAGDRCFSAGADLKEMVTFGGPLCQDSRKGFLKVGRSPFLSLISIVA